jgi:CheY-like chemotaxis protein
MMQRILWADDERDLRTFLQTELQNAGYRVTAVANGVEAVIAAVDTPHDLYLRDMLMPGMNRIQTIQVLRKVTPKVPIIGLTGYTGQGYVARASTYRVTCLSKPVNSDDLVKAITIQIERASRSQTKSPHNVARI